MSRNLLLLGGGILAIVIVVGFLIPTIQQDSGFSFGYQVIGEDANGSPVTIPFSWWINGIEVTSIRPTVTWSATGSNIDWSTLYLAGQFRIYRLNYQGTNPTDITPVDLSFQRSGADDQEGSLFFSLNCDLIIDGVSVSGIDSDDNEYWNIQISIKITGSVEQEGSYGDDLSDTYEEDLTFRITWIDGSFTIGGGLGR